MSASISKLPISVCTLCLNEADRIPSCLAFADEFEEWIVLDTGSTDGSQEIAGNYNVDIRSAEWKGFSETRVRHFQLASQPWILWIDADEFMTREFIDELRELFSEGTDLSHAAFEVNRLMRFEGKWIRHGDWFPDRVTRLFRSDSWSMLARSVHESLIIDGTIGRLDSTLPHYSYRNPKDRERRVERYAELWVEQQSEAGKKSYFFSASSRALWKLIRGLLLKRGFLDGRIGFWIAWSNASEVFLKYRKLRECQLSDRSSVNRSSSVD